MPFPKKDTCAWDESIMNGSTIDQESKSNPDALFNRKDPRAVCFSEQGWHRVAIQMHCRGSSNQEIARRLGKSNIWVGQILRQPWAKEAMLREIRAMGQEEMDAILQAEVINSMWKIVEVRDGEDTKPQDVLRASEYIINRRHGTPTAKIEHSGSIDMDTMSDAELLAIVSSGKN